jgi:hypothetical protein
MYMNKLIMILYSNCVTASISYKFHGVLVQMTSKYITHYVNNSLVSMITTETA